MIIDLTIESASTLRELADSLSTTMDEMEDDTEQLIAVYRSVTERLGVHEENFSDMLEKVTKTQEDANEAVRLLIPKMLNVADAIEVYVNDHPSI
ncbi:MAG: hypothetical protein J5979_08500 [Lachnospiraceae bacterium]|nr:hypothetical protein [Lachnospiraceae bacterium]